MATDSIFYNCKAAHMIDSSLDPIHYSSILPINEVSTRNGRIVRISKEYDTGSQSVVALSSRVVIPARTMITKVVVRCNEEENQELWVFEVGRDLNLALGDHIVVKLHPLSENTISISIEVDWRETYRSLYQ